MEPLFARHRSKSRRGFWLGPGPIVVGLLSAVGILAAWRLVSRPDAPSTFWKHDPVVERRLAFPWATSIYMVHGSTDRDAILFVGDSRASAGISLRVLRREGLEPVGILWSGLAQLDDLLRAARELPARRLVVALSPASLHAPPLGRMARQLDLERQMTWPQRVDRRLDSELDVLRQRVLRTVELNALLFAPQAERAQPRRQEGLYFGLLDERSREAREEKLVALQHSLLALKEAGWSIACLRLPAELRVEQIEDAGFAPGKFAQMCADLDVPYLDLSGGGYATSDGSHLLGADADRASERIALWLSGLSFGVGR